MSLRYCCGIWLDRLRKVLKNLNEDIAGALQGFETGTSQYKPREMMVLEAAE